MEMFGNASAAASLFHTGLSTAGLTDHLAGLEACASLENAGFGTTTSGSTIGETTSNLVSLASNSVIGAGRIANHSNSSVSNSAITSAPNNGQYTNSNPYSIHHHQPSGHNQYHHAASIYHNNYTSAAISTLGYHDAIANSSYAGLTYPGASLNHTLPQQRLFSRQSLEPSGSLTQTGNSTSDSTTLSDGNILVSSLLSPASASISVKEAQYDIKARKELNYSPPNSTSSFLSSPTTAKLKKGSYLNRIK